MSLIDAAYVAAIEAATGVRLTDWQRRLLTGERPPVRHGKREPYRTVAHVGRPVPEIESSDGVEGPRLDV